MTEKVLDSLKKIGNYTKANFLLAVSGGVDSMVLLDVFKTLGVTFSIAHCNFQLRGKESDLDEELVVKIAKRHRVHCFCESFETQLYKQQKGISIQMAARDLRYSWFKELTSKHRFDFVVTAHHLDDNIETIFLNLVRGTGIKGIVGMNMLNQSTFRPMLDVSKEEILEYAKINNIEFRDDESNKTDGYKRNKIRNQILPLFQELNPNFIETMRNNISHLNDATDFYKKSIEEELNILLKIDSNKNICISITELLKSQTPKLLLFEFLNKYGFNTSQVDDLYTLISSDTPTGKHFFSNSYNLLVNRNEIIISTYKQMPADSILINNQDNFVTYANKLTLKKLPVSKIELNSNSDYAFLDADKVKFPLLLRKWKPGDKFVPLGMTGKKKVSDFLIDSKVSKFAKEKIYVLETNGRICWIIGQRIDDNFKITSETKNVLRLTVED